MIRSNGIRSGLMGALAIALASSASFGGSIAGTAYRHTDGPYKTHKRKGFSNGKSIPTVAERKQKRKEQRKSRRKNR